MSIVRSSADFINTYNDISKQCHASDEPIFITENGKNDLVVMSIESYEKMHGKLDLYNQLSNGLNDIKVGNTRPFKAAMADIRSKSKR